MNCWNDFMCEGRRIDTRLRPAAPFPKWWIDNAAKRIEGFLNYDPDAWKDDHARFLLECRNERNKNIIDRALARLFGGKP